MTTPRQPPQPRAAVRRTPPAVHGAAQVHELRAWGLEPTQVLDFSANLNPYGPPPPVVRALQRAAWNRYPERDAGSLRVALARHHNRTPAEVAVGNGSAELIAAVAWAYLRSGDTALVLGPTFGEYARVSRLADARVVEVRAPIAPAFRADPAQVADALARWRPRVVWLAHPNNPTGQPVDLAALRAWSQAHPETLFVVDEAYLPVSPGVPSALSLTAANVVVLRSWTKDLALAGVRLGYALAPQPVAEALRRVLPPWNVSAGAQAAGLAALHPQALTWRAATVRRWQRDAAALRVALTALGAVVVPGLTPFFLVRVGNGAQCRQRLLHHRVLVRDAASFGLPAYVRLSPRRPRANARLLAAWARECATMQTRATIVRP